ncbi:MAG: hypothetical protein JWO07_232 [Candidatus Saccharibacteria bacterium]|nr:hypothetical protein [Candidatus Saccharibacteria bacterium]
MPKWVKPVIITVAAVIGGSLLYWQMSQGESLLRLNGYSYHFTVMRSDAERAKGLSGTKSLSSDQAMIFVFPQDGSLPMWMKDMNYPIDMVWLNDDKEVVYTVKDAEPSSYNAVDPSKSTQFASPTSAHYVIELPSGTIDRTGIKSGEPAGLPSNI